MKIKSFAISALLGYSSAIKQGMNTKGDGEDPKDT